ncbi:hypothetical protein GKQ23_01510 [Erwinia sp. E602]|uniref:hypothetical protein n=1 Tax=unclassified Erwinia TaxID=2622719 RepID=UPI0006FE5A62|nr:MULTISPECIES: hypothetical protein [unclassified Erwinia]KQN53859.1 hypothetical protein ASF13_14230 [Erwinia sp. Leaf53]PLV62336.1 hypothetical protein NV64_05740 [Erwinia sp. B116]QUG73764.1 hypothetical protein GKQ23_01510 [Erwinia sp. E602]
MYSEQRQALFEELHRQIEDVLNDSPLSLEEKMAVIIRFSYLIMRSSRGNLVEMEVSDGSKISVRLEPPRVAH